ncbi:hypothetical protein Q428_11290 [Fervidicella metallireducens AeB]|uniref:Uncharacterized protein n=1 Tax=Fervidicella metallireducens AeB TaxID=1403537 RepID=A0A017RT95_9CLOT|nr:hypothetical protein [Fervidicella metallireducens]EYE87836.1 hypothetical protein Q428_11290 [Fervidicella metallireducens AeB]
MQYHLKKVNEDLYDISLQLTALSINNIEWGCLYSGLGIIHTPDEKEKKHLSSIFKENNEKLYILENLVLTKCIYSKGKPFFSPQPDCVLDPGKYMWDYKTFEKTINPSTQAFAVLASLRSADFIFEYNKALALVLFKISQLYYEFLSTFLRNEEGLFISYENKSKEIKDNLKLKALKEDPSILTQVYVHEAALMLKSISQKDEYVKYFKNQKNFYSNDVKNIFNFIFENYNELLDLSSKDMSLCISSLCRCCIISKEEEDITNYRHLIALLCAELESRVKITGEVDKNYNANDNATLITHFRTASALMEGYMETDIDKFKELSLSIFGYVKDLLDENTGLFIMKDTDNISYTIRDIAEINKLLLLLYNDSVSEEIIKILKNFYKSSIIDSGIVLSLPDFNISFGNTNSSYSVSSPLSHENNKAPVFIKGFKISKDETKLYSQSKRYHSNYSLYSSYIFLTYFSPYLKLKETVIEKESLNFEKDVNANSENIYNVNTNAESTLPSSEYYMERI